MNEIVLLTDKERARASSDGYVIVSRPAAQGGYNVFAVRVHDSNKIGWDRHVDHKSDISAACTSINRDMDKFLGVGAKMSSSGRLRPGRKEFKRGKAEGTEGG